MTSERVYLVSNFATYSWLTPLVTTKLSASHKNSVGKWNWDYTASKIWSHDQTFDFLKELEWCPYKNSVLPEAKLSRGRIFE